MEFQQLKEQILTKVQQKQESLETRNRKLDLCRLLSDCVRKYNPAYRLETVGSTISGFSISTSDIDMCLILDNDNENVPRDEAIKLLETICPVFKTVPNLIIKELILAKVPILKLQEQVHGIDVDINVNNAVGIRNSSLLHSYALCDWRVRPLVIVVKLWAQIQGINESKCLTLSSYSLALMVIHFLQYGMSTPVLPCLQSVSDDPNRFPELAELWRIKKTLSAESVTAPAVSHMENSQSLGELLLGFLEYFAVKFSYRTCVISVRTGSLMSVSACSKNQAPKNDSSQWKYVCIEEPFEYTNTARSVCTKESFDLIRGVFCWSWQRLLNSRNLDAIFTSISRGELQQIGTIINSRM